MNAKDFMRVASPAIQLRFSAANAQNLSKGVKVQLHHWQVLGVIANKRFMCCLLGSEEPQFGPVLLMN